ncbi:MAG: hypothetical protein DYG85_04195 [Chloroflexi bacterium CFX1]|nr:hypothetical protein [Chloroflexi bacterium CFX1]MDL1918314.1 hypothetical protein [Chloroflexi bacterium CFX5]
MSRGKVIGIGIILLIILSLISGYLFYANTGGKALSRVVWHYFFRDLPDKKYSWQDFTERGEGQGISGFYAWGDEERFYLWTLSGLKRFAHVPGISIYQHEDICAALKRVEANPEAVGSAKASKTVTGNIEAWQGLIKQENLVSVVRLPKTEHSNGVDKVWSYSGKYKILNKLERGTCD